MITLNQIQAFAAVARNRSFTRAASELHVAQSSVSYQVRELERVLRVRLVELVGRRVRLTDAGERLLTRATALLGDLDDIAREMAEYGAGERGPVRLGATHAVGSYALPPLLARFRRAHPGIDLHLTVDNVRGIEHLLVERAVDLAIVDWPVQSPALDARTLRRDAVVLIAPPDHPLAGRGPVEVGALRGQTFVQREPGSGTRDLAEQVLGPLAGDVSVALELAQPEGVVRAVEAGMGLAFISELIVTDKLAAGAVRQIPLVGVQLSLDVSMVVARDRLLPPASAQFRDFLLDA